MPTAFVKGDIFETEGLRAYAFGAHTDGTLNVGIAIAIKKRWPAFAAAYAERCASQPLAVGDVFTWSEGDVTIFALGIAQGDKPPSFSALTNSVRRMLQLAVQSKVKRVGLYRISGVDWTRARKMLNEVTVGQSSVQLDVFEQFIRSAAS